jgi:hypothetical protein
MVTKRQPIFGNARVYAGIKLAERVGLELLPDVELMVRIPSEHESFATHLCIVRA